MSLTSPLLVTCPECGRRYNTDVTGHCPECDRDTWHQIADGLRTAWEHADTDRVVAIEPETRVDHGHMESPETATKTKQYQVTIRSERGGPMIWPRDYPEHRGLGLFQTYDQADNAAAFVREYISDGGSISDLEVDAQWR